MKRSTAVSNIRMTDEVPIVLGFYNSVRRLSGVRAALPAVFLPLWLCCSTGVFAAGGQENAATSDSGGFGTANVVVDGRVILTVRGLAAYPAKRRASEIRDQIISAAEDESIPPGAVVIRERDDRIQMMAGNRLLVEVLDADADMEGVGRKILAEAKQLLLQEALTNYRLDRTPKVLLTKSLYALAATLVAIGLLFGFRKGLRSLQSLLERRLTNQLKALETQSARFVKAQQLARFLRSFLKVVYVVLVALTLYFYFNYVLGLYPWTRGFADWLFDLILSPLQIMGAALLADVPDLIFLVILYYVIRYVLHMIKAFFDGIAQGAIELRSFEREWAWPTYRILRVVVIIFAVVVAYPYIPGSQSEAFKGITILLGLIVSLGSSSIIANIIAGYSLTYRRPFRIGDRVRINDNLGDVMEIRVLVTRLRSLKNEEIVIPNTSVLNGDVVNYSTLARKQGLILHTTVGIGFETPWRQVEAMLKLAAARTSGLQKKPKPFVLQKELGDFAVTYELNAHCSDPKNMAQIYSGLHRNILDVFNEYGVAIMTPSYEADPPQPKLVPKDRWYQAPAPQPPKPDSG